MHRHQRFLSKKQLLKLGVSNFEKSKTNPFWDWSETTYIDLIITQDRVLATLGHLDSSRVLGIICFTQKIYWLHFWNRIINKNLVLN